MDRRGWDSVLGPETLLYRKDGELVIGRTHTSEPLKISLLSSSYLAIRSAT